MPVQITPALLYKTAAFLNAITVPGHVLFGLQTVFPGINTMKTDKKEGEVAKASVTACFNYINGALIVAGIDRFSLQLVLLALTVLALLNWQWAKTGGPKTLEEKGIFWTLAINGLIDGATYFRVGEYPPLGFAWVAPALGVAAQFL